MPRHLLAEATGIRITDVRLALRRLAEQLKSTGNAAGRGADHRDLRCQVSRRHAAFQLPTKRYAGRPKSEWAAEARAAWPWPPRIPPFGWLLFDQPVRVEHEFLRSPFVEVVVTLGRVVE